MVVRILQCCHTLCFLTQLRYFEFSALLRFYFQNFDISSFFILERKYFFVYFIVNLKEFLLAWWKKAEKTKFMRWNWQVCFIRVWNPFLFVMLLFVYCISVQIFLFRSSQRRAQAFSECTLHSNCLQRRCTLRLRLRKKISAWYGIEWTFWCLLRKYTRTKIVHAHYLFEIVKRFLHQANRKFWFSFQKLKKLEISSFFPDDRET